MAILLLQSAKSWEEAGVVGKAKKRPLGYYTYLKTLDNGGKIPTVVEVHALKADKVHSTFPELDQPNAPVTIRRSWPSVEPIAVAAQSE